MTAEYVDDVPYVRQFVGELSPPQLRVAAALNGVTPPPGDDFDYCELGCAHGDTLAALAAAHPHARFLGIDLSALHIASAKRVARDAALENVGFLERDFGDLLAEDIGEFDYIVAHGVLTWVSPDKRGELIAFAQAKLKPGGLLYVSYNAMPGWGAVEPLRQLLLSPPGGSEGTTLERARRGLAFAQAVERAGAEYFTRNPAASEMLATMTKVGLPYLVHEYMHQHWTPMYFARVAWEMAASDLHFAGVLPLYGNFRDTAIPDSLGPVVADVTDRLTFESLKDFATNEFFRRDLYVKGEAPRSSAATDAYLDATPWSLRTNATRVVRLPHRTLSLEGAPFDALFAALGDGATTGAALAETGRDAAQIRAALRRLLVADAILPLRAPVRLPVVRADARYEVPVVYNATVLRRIAVEAPLVLTSTVAGTAFPVSALDALAIRVLVEVPGPERDGWIDAFVARSVLRLRVGDRVLEDRAAQTGAIRDAVSRLCAQDLARLVALGILAPAP